MGCYNRDSREYKSIEKRYGKTTHFILNGMKVDGKIPTIRQTDSYIRSKKREVARELYRQLRANNSFTPSQIAANLKGIIHFSQGQYYITKGASMNEFQRMENERVVFQPNFEIMTALQKSFPDIFSITKVGRFKNTYAVNINTPKGKQGTLFQLTNISEEANEATEKTIRDLAARMSARIGIKVVFISDRTQNFKGKVDGSIAVINLAYATLDTPIHEILAHPIIRSIKNRNDVLSYEEWVQTLITYQLPFEEDQDISQEAYKKYLEWKKNSSNLYNNLIKELEYGKGKEVLDNVKKRYVYKSNPEIIEEVSPFNGETIYYVLGRQFPTKESALRYQKNETESYTLEEQQEEAIVELLGLMTAEKLNNVKDGKLISLLKRLLKEMKEFMRSLFNKKEIEINELPDEMTLNDLANLLAYSNSKLILPGYRVKYTTPDNLHFKTYSEASNHISKLFNESKDVELGDIKLSLDLTESDVQRIKKYEEDLNSLKTWYESELYQMDKKRKIKEADKKLKDFIKANKEPLYDQEPYLSYEDRIKYNLKTYQFTRLESTYSRPNIYLKDKFGYKSFQKHRDTLGENYEGYYIHAYNKGGDNKIIPITKKEALEIYNKDETSGFTPENRTKLFKLIKQLDNITNDYQIKKEIESIENNINQIKIGESGIKGFIKRNKEFEQSKEIIDSWKKENNIIYNPEEIYSRGQEFVSVIGAYSLFDVDLMMQNLLQHIEDNEKAGGKFSISAFTRPTDRKLTHIESNGGKIKIKIYPKSEDILWAANRDVYSGSVWDAGDKVNKDKTSELLGVSHTKYPSLNSVESVQPNLTSIIDNLAHGHNELGITLTGNNFRLEYDEDIPYKTKKIIDGVNSILDQKYGKLIKPKTQNINKKLTPREIIRYTYLEVKAQKAEKMEIPLSETMTKSEIDELNNLKIKKQELVTQPKITLKSLKKSIKEVKQDYMSMIKTKGAPSFVDVEISKEEYESKIKTKTEEVNTSYWKKIPSYQEHATEPGKMYRYFDKEGNVYFRNVIEKIGNPSEMLTNDELTEYEDLQNAMSTADEIGISYDDMLGNLKERYYELQNKISFYESVYKRRIQKQDKDYTSQALINTKVAKLKEVSKKYPRILIKSEVEIENIFDDYDYYQLTSLGFTERGVPIKELVSEEEFNELSNEEREAIKKCN